MKELTNEIIIEFLTHLFPDDMDGIWADSECESFSFNSKYFASEELSGNIIGISYKAAMGTTKICFMLDGYDNVIKMPLTGIYATYYDEDNDEDYYELIEDVDINDIDTEIDRYHSASPAMKNFLLPNIFIGKIRDIPVYKQEAVKDTFYSFMIDHRDKITKNESKNIKLASKYRDEGIGIELPVRFVSSIIETHHNFKDILLNIKNITDLHNENIGYTYSGKAVCFDYAM